MRIFKEENIKLNQFFNSKLEAIIASGEILVNEGYVSKDYINDMIKRDIETSTYIGNNIAIPHGIVKSVEKIHHSGISLLQIPDGIEFDGNLTYLVFGIAGKNNEHLEILGKIATVCSEMKNVDAIRFATTEKQVLRIFEEVEV